MPKVITISDKAVCDAHRFTFSIDPINPQPELICEAAQVIRSGGIVVFPTRCLYGLGTDAFNDKAVDRLFEIKQRPYQKPILVLITDRDELSRLVKQVPRAASILMDTFWPGMLTIVFEAKDNLPKNLTAGTGKIGVRLCEHPIASALINAVGCPITGTSANLAGESGCSRIPDLKVQLVSQVNLILDAGILEGGIGSTVIDVTHDFPKIVRQGIVLAKEIFEELARQHFRLE